MKNSSIINLKLPFVFVLFGIISMHSSCTNPEDTFENSGNTKSGNLTVFQSQNSTDSLKVMYYNIHKGIGMDGVYNLNRTIQVLQNSNADIIGIGEISRGYDAETNYDDQVEIILNNMPSYPYWHFQKTSWHSPTSEFGNLLLSKYPIVESQDWIFTARDNHKQGLIEAKININNKTFYFYLTHIAKATYPNVQSSQIEEILKYTSYRGGPKILVGDFNFKPNTTKHDVITTGFQDPLGTSPTPYTWRADGKYNKRLDYLFGNEHVYFGNVNIVNTQASDHFPIVANVALDFNSFKFMHYTIHWGGNSNGQYNLNDIINDIRSSGADIIALSQVDMAFSSRSNYDKQIQILADSLHMVRTFHKTLSYPSNAECNCQERKFGQGFLSKFPISGSSWQQRWLYTERQPNSNNRQGLFKARINVNGNHAYFYVTSFGSGGTNRLAQANEAKSWIINNNHRWKIFSGNLNDDPNSASVTAMLDIFDDTFSPQNTSDYNYPSQTPEKTINYIFINDNITSSNSNVINSQSSTHRPISTTLTLK